MMRCVCNCAPDRKSTRLNSSHGYISYAVFCLKKKKTQVRPVFPLGVRRDTSRYPLGLATSLCESCDYFVQSAPTRLMVHSIATCPTLPIATRTSQTLRVF